MKKTTGVQYVKDFSFPSECGFTGSAGAKSVKGYMRGGKVKGAVSKSRNTPNTKHRGAKGTTRAAMGGYMGDAPGQQKIGYQGPNSGDREVSVDGVKITMPRAKGGRAKGKMSTHDKLKKHGAEMGFMYGGAVKKRDSNHRPANIGRKKYNPNPKDKNTSSEFVQKKSKQATRDHGVQPANRGSTSQEREAGGRGRLKPGFAKGGLAMAATSGEAHGRDTKVHKRLDRGGKRPYVESKPRTGSNPNVQDTSTRRSSRRASPDHTKGKGRSKKGFPATVKAKGGRVKYNMKGMPKGVK